MTTWIEREIVLPRMTKGCHNITRQIVEALPEIGQTEVGLLSVFLQHTSASLTINENADPDVLVDLDRALDAVAPEDFPYRHACEGPDDMPAHVKSSLLGSSLTVPIGDGRLRLGTWQGIYLCEHRRHASGRRLVLTVQGELGRAGGRGSHGRRPHFCVARCTPIQQPTVRLAIFCFRRNPAGDRLPGREVKVK